MSDLKRQTCRTFEAMKWLAQNPKCS